MEHLNWILTVLGAMTLALGLASKWLQKSFLPPTVLALFFGIVLGPKVLGVIDLAALGDRTRILEGVARVTLGIGLVGVALRLPREYPRRHWREMLTLIGLGMIGMWAVSSALVYFILGQTFWMAALIGAIITATDPVAASPIVSGELSKKTLPDRVRHAISFESGANDGLSFLFVFLPFLFLTKPEGEAVSHWFKHTLLFDVGAATLLGLATGFIAGKGLRWAEKAGSIAEHWRLVYTVALALFAVGLGKLVGSDEVLVVFAAGATFVQVVSSDDRKNEEQGQEAVNRMVAVPVFTVLGAAIPWEGWFGLGWSGLALGAAVLFLRRPPLILLMRPMLRSVENLRDALFIGWFGPIAVAAIYYASIMEHKLKEPMIWDVVSLVACLSVVVHGATAAPLTRAYAAAGQRN